MLKAWARSLNDQGGHDGRWHRRLSGAVDFMRGGPLPDVVVLDFRLTGGTGADAAMVIRQIRSETKLIFLTREDTNGARIAALEAGASAFIYSHAQHRRWSMQSESWQAEAHSSPLGPSQHCSRHAVVEPDSAGEGSPTVDGRRCVSSREIASRLGINWVVAALAALIL